MSDKKLEESIDQAEWNWIKPHLGRQAVILVGPSLKLISVGEALVQNDTQSVDTWIKQGDLSKPTPDKITFWNDNPSKKFAFLIVQPYVLIQEIPETYH